VRFAASSASSVWATSSTGAAVEHRHRRRRREHDEQRAGRGRRPAGTLRAWRRRDYRRRRERRRPGAEPVTPCGSSASPWRGDVVPARRGRRRCLPRTAGRRPAPPPRSPSCAWATSSTSAAVECQDGERAGLGPSAPPPRRTVTRPSSWTPRARADPPPRRSAIPAPAGQHRHRDR
jgi:hypothetical protein